MKVVVMGVSGGHSLRKREKSIISISGCGKTTVGLALAESLSVKFYDGDDFHSEENKSKMRSGRALTDEDRQPWLSSLSTLLGGEEGCVLACSALRKCYRWGLYWNRTPDNKIVQRNVVSRRE